MAQDAGKQKPPSLEEFSKRLDAARGDRTDAENVRAGDGKGMGKAFRLSSELLAALIVGVVLDPQDRPVAEDDRTQGDHGTVRFLIERPWFGRHNRESNIKGQR